MILVYIYIIFLQYKGNRKNSQLFGVNFLVIGLLIKETLEKVYWKLETTRTG